MIRIGEKWGATSCFGPFRLHHHIIHLKFALKVRTAVIQKFCSRLRYCMFTSKLLHGYTHKLRSCYQILVRQTLERRILVQLQVSAHFSGSAPQAPVHNTTRLRHLKCHLKGLSKHTRFWFVFNFTGSEKLHPSHACISTMLNPSEWQLHVLLTMMPSTQAQHLHYPRVLRNCKKINIHFKTNTLKSHNWSLVF